jgi:hypothetical protein
VNARVGAVEPLALRVVVGEEAARDNVIESVRDECLVAPAAKGAALPDDSLAVQRDMLPLGEQS